MSPLANLFANLLYRKSRARVRAVNRRVAVSKPITESCNSLVEKDFFGIKMNHSMMNIRGI